jgi:hypothetical protein
MQYQRSIEEIMDEMVCDIEYQFDFEDNIELSQIPSYKIKHVTFNYIPSIRVIPNKEDIIENSIARKNELWWSNMDYMWFRFSANNDIMQFVRRYPKENFDKIHKRLWYEYDEECYSGLYKSMNI